MIYVGIDVSKATLEVAYSSDKSKGTTTFANNTKGIRKFIQTLNKDEHHCVMEATGNYSALLLYLLNQAGITTSMENPLKIKNFARSLLTVTKTDRTDARLIARYGEMYQPEPYHIPSDTIMLLKQKRTVIRQLRKQLIASKNLQQSLACLPKIDAGSKAALKKTIICLEKQIETLEDELNTLTNAEFKHQMELLTSIKGIGVTVAAALIISTGGFTYFDSAKQVSRYLGLCPTYQQSGTSVHIKGHINRNGDAYTRSQLYLAALPAARYNSECKELYTRLTTKGKSGKLAVVAVANKLIRQAFAVIKHDQPYIDGFRSVKP